MWFSLVKRIELLVCFRGFRPRFHPLNYKKVYSLIHPVCHSVIKPLLEMTKCLNFLIFWIITPNKKVRCIDHHIFNFRLNVSYIYVTVWFDIFFFGVNSFKFFIYMQTSPWTINHLLSLSFTLSLLPNSLKVYPNVCLFFRILPHNFKHITFVLITKSINESKLIRF